MSTSRTEPTTELRAPSNTARLAALGRAVHYVRGEEPKIFSDKLARGLLGFADDESMLQFADSRPTMRGLHTLLNLRSRWAEDQLASEVSAREGKTQYLILGAGLDSFAYRCTKGLLDRLEIFEVDHPGSQAWKRQQVTEQGLHIPEQLHYVPVDFERDDLTTQLEKAGFDRTKPVFASLLGVSQYITKEVLAQTLRDVALLSNAGCTWVMEYVPPLSLLEDAEERERLEVILDRVAEVGEPWITYFTDEDITTLLRESGFPQVAVFSAPALEKQYLASRKTDNYMPRAAAYLWARVEPSNKL